MRDAKAGDRATAASDPRVGLLLTEAFRHDKAILAFGDGRQVLVELGIAGAGVTTGDAAGDVVDDLVTLLGSHRVWERSAAVG